MNVLIVVAHPDDEALGCGGTAALLADKGVGIRACFLSASVDVRTNRPADAELERHTLRAQELLGLGAPILGGFPNIAFNAVPHVQLVQFIEQAIVESQADAIFTHHPGDLNDDHRHTSLACQAAARLFQRRGGHPPLRSLRFMEVLSSTEWSLAGPSASFVPNGFIEIGEELLQRKIDALAAYEGVIRQFPHPRSTQVIRALAAFRGAQAGMVCAEAFQTAFEDIGTCFG